MGRLAQLGLAPLLVSLAATCAAAQWKTDVTDPGTSTATTTNDRGQGFGQVCFVEEGVCYWVLALSVPCTEDMRYPILGNADTIATALEVYCFGPMNGIRGYGYVFTNFNLVDHMVRSNPRIGFAFPMEHDEFRVIRFDLIGATQALDRMRAVNARKNPSPVMRGTHDQRM